MVEVDGCPGYFVDEGGRVYSARRGALYELRQFDRRTLKGKASPYLSVNLYRRNRFVHTLVCVAYHGPRPKGAEVCHGEGGSRDNRAINLRWDTKEANSAERALCSGEAWQEAHAHRFSDLLGGEA